MIGIIVTGHGHFATGLTSSLHLITGITENVVAVDFEADHSTMTLKTNLEKAFVELKECDGVLVLADLPGASPFNNAVIYKSEQNEQKIEVLAGTNLPMLIEAATIMAAYEEPMELVENVLETGKESIVHFEI